jgi:hypothetical protein
VAPKSVPVSPSSVFLNVPYDDRFQPLYLAYIVGLIHLGFEPRATLGIPGGDRRLNKILREIQGCRYSIHDMSRVQLDRQNPRTPRFNMPFELGLAVAWAELYPSMHTWFLFEKLPYRIQKLLSDVNGTDPHTHGETVQGVLRGLCSAFVRPNHQPIVPQMMKTHRIITRRLSKILEDVGAENPFEASAFQSICFVVKALVEAG